MLDNKLIKSLAEALEIANKYKDAKDNDAKASKAIQEKGSALLAEIGSTLMSKGVNPKSNETPLKNLNSLIAETIKEKGDSIDENDIKKALPRSFMPGSSAKKARIAKIFTIKKDALENPTSAQEDSEIKDSDTVSTGSNETTGSIESDIDLEVEKRSSPLSRYTKNQESRKEPTSNEDVKDSDIDKVREIKTEAFRTKKEAPKSKSAEMVKAVKDLDSKVVKLSSELDETLSETRESFSKMYPDKDPEEAIKMPPKITTEELKDKKAGYKEYVKISKVSTNDNTNGDLNPPEESEDIKLNIPEQIPGNKRKPVFIALHNKKQENAAINLDTNSIGGDSGYDSGPEEDNMEDLEFLLKDSSDPIERPSEDESTTPTGKPGTSPATSNTTKQLLSSGMVSSADQGQRKGREGGMEIGGLDPKDSTT